MHLTPETIQPVHSDRFPLDGRGPELLRVVYYNERGCKLQGIEYQKLNVPFDAAHLKHVRVTRAQAVMVTPHEVINFGDWAMGFVQHHGSAAFDLGRSNWLRSF